MLKTMNGNVKKTSSGFRIALKKVSKRTTHMSVNGPSQRIPGMNFVESATPKASTDQRTNI